MQNLKRWTTVLAFYVRGPLWYSNTGNENVFWVFRCKTARKKREVQSYRFIITCARSGTCTSYSATSVHEPCRALSLHTVLALNIAGQTVSGCWTISRRWYRAEILMWMFASKITVKYPQTHDYCTWFYLTKLLTSRPRLFQQYCFWQEHHSVCPVVLLVESRCFSLSKRSFQVQTVESTSQHWKQILENDSGAVFCPDVLFSTEI